VSLSEKDLRELFAFFWRSPHVDRRLAVQKSRFLTFGKVKDLTRTKMVRQNKSRLAKIVIPKSNRYAENQRIAASQSQQFSQTSKISVKKSGKSGESHAREE
jgi:hypothetical protein